MSNTFPQTLTTLFVPLVYSTNIVLVFIIRLPKNTVSILESKINFFYFSVFRVTGQSWHKYPDA